MMKKNFSMYLLLALVMAFSSCNKEEDDDKSESTEEATINGTQNDYNVSFTKYSEATSRLTMDLVCKDCPITLNFSIDGSMSPGIFTSEGEQGEGCNFCRIEIEDDYEGGRIDFALDSSKVEITSANEAEKTISGTFEFDHTENIEYSGSGSFNNVSYE